MNGSTVDLTRFDFNAKDFLTSESVRRMSDAEVGQYILLLAESWLTGKDCTLPDDNEFLARLAHTSAVSGRVIEQFPLVQTTPQSRRRNARLYREWLLALDRSEMARSLAGRRWKKDVPIACDGNANAYAKADANACANALPLDMQTQCPNQTKPNQTNLATSSSSLKAENEALAVRWVFDYYVSKLGRNPKMYLLTAQRRSALRARLPEFIKITGSLTKAVELMAQCINKLTESDWHMGRDSRTNGKTYNDLMNIFAPSKIQQWLAKLENSIETQIDAPETNESIHSGSEHKILPEPPEEPAADLDSEL